MRGSRVDLPSNVGPQADQGAEKTTESETFAKLSDSFSAFKISDSFSAFLLTFKVLGLVWNYKTDQLCFKLSEIANMARKGSSY